MCPAFSFTLPSLFPAPSQTSWAAARNVQSSTPELGWKAELSPTQPIFLVVDRECMGRRAALHFWVAFMLPSPVQLQVPSLLLSTHRESATGLGVKQPFVPPHPDSTAFSFLPFSLSALLLSPSSPLQDALPLLSPAKWTWGRLEEPTGRGKEPASSSRCCPSVPLLGAARRRVGTLSHKKQPKILSTESVILRLRVNTRRAKGREYLSPLCTA